MPHASLSAFGPATQRWFTDAFAAPTPVQARGWPVIAGGHHTLLLAPTGSGKTLAAFLASLDRLSRRPADAPPGVRVLYLSPLKALAYDIERNLRAPLVGMARAAERADEPFQPITVGVRTGDTAQRERRDMLRHPPDVLVTTPESLFLFLGSGQREILRTVHTVIVDEIHAVAGTKRGVHLALSLERLSAFLDDEPQRIGLSATQRPLEEIARFLGGGREVEVVDTSEPPRLALEIMVTTPDMDAPHVAQPEGGGGGQRQVKPSIWPAIHPALLDLIRSHRTTIVFANSRLGCERLAQSLNELAGEELVKAHHGSIARAQREIIEDQLKRGALPALVATSSLELGIDMGTVDLVVQIGSPGSVARGLQRIGRAGHGVGEVSEGRIFPKFKGDLLESAVVAQHMRDANVETTRVPRNCLDVLAQHIVSMTAVDPWTVSALEAVITAAYPYSTLSRPALVAVLDMLSGRYPSDAFADLRPRINWDRGDDTLVARKGAGTLALVNAGTIPDRGMYGVFLGSGGPRIGELDEEMVYESRQGDVVILGASSWRIQEITRDRVVVTPAPGEPGRLPFWHGDSVGRPVDLGRALGAFVHEVGQRDADAAVDFVCDAAPLDRIAGQNLVRYVHEQREATGALPTDKTLVVERFRDELGDWRVCILSPFGARVHTPWALAIEALLSTRAGFDVQVVATDDGLVVRFADVDDLPDLGALFPDPDEVADLVTEQLRHSAVFASHFRENAGRALLLPRRSPSQRRPLWQQRLKAQGLLAEASKYPAFPIILETFRECLQDVFDVPSLVALLADVRSRAVRVEQVETRSPSPFARSLVFAYVAEFLYSGDAPAAERRAFALTLDRALLRDLLGEEQLRELLDPAATAAVIEELQHLALGWRAEHADAVHDLLRRLGDLTADEVADRSAADPAAWLAALASSRRAILVRVVGGSRWIAAEDAGRYQDALGVELPSGLPAAFTSPSPEPLVSLVHRWARTHGPFRAHEVADRFGLRVAQVTPILGGLEAEGHLLQAGLQRGGTGLDWCHTDVLQRLRRRSLAAQRREVEAVAPEVLTRFLLGWHGLGGRRGGRARLEEVIAQLEGRPLPFSALEGTVLPGRVADFQPRMLDELGAIGQVVWVGAGALGSKDGRVALYRRERVPLLVPSPEPLQDAGPLHTAILDHLGARGASFLVALSVACGGPKGADLTAALWDLVWAGLVTNDTFLPLRALSSRKRGVGVSAAGGRWSLVEDLRLAVVAPTPTEGAHARAVALLERYGVVSREAAHADDLVGGFGAVYPVLRAMEHAGKVRRGWFVDGLTGAQFASPGVVDRLRGHRAATTETVCVSAVDPANPLGTLLPWPVRVAGVQPRRVAGATVVFVGGVPVVYRLRTRLITLAGWEDAERVGLALGALTAGRFKSFRVSHIDGQVAREELCADALGGAGFSRDYKGWVLLRS